MNLFIINFIIGFFILGQALICLSQSDGDGSVELPCRLDNETLKKAKGTLDISTTNLRILRCLCKLKIANNASQSASNNVGVDLNIVNCDGVINPDPSKKIDYKIYIYSSFIVNTDPENINSYIFISAFNEDYEYSNSTVLKKMEKDDCLYFGLGEMEYGTSMYLINIEKDNSIEQICDEFDEGTDEYNFLKIVKYVLVGGNDCPIEKDTTSRVKRDPDPIIISVNDPWPCGLITLFIILGDKSQTKGEGLLGLWNWNIEGDCLKSY